MLFAGVVFAVSVPLTSARAAVAGSADLGTGPTAGNGSITASGGYVAPPTAPAATSATLFAYPTGGGLAQSVAQANAPANGAWGPITINDLAVGQYYVVVLVQFGNLGQFNVTSPVAVVNVVNAGGNPVAPPGTAAFGPGDPTTAAGKIQVGVNGAYAVTDATYAEVGASLYALSMDGKNPAPGIAAAPAPANNKWGLRRTTTSPRGCTWCSGG